MLGLGESPNRSLHVLSKPPDVQKGDSTFSSSDPFGAGNEHISGEERRQTLKGNLGPSNNIIVAKVSRFTLDDFPVMISPFNVKLTLVVDKRFRNLWANLESGQLRTFDISFLEFDVCGTPRFMWRREYIVSMWCITDVECAFLANFCPDEAKDKFSVCLLCDGARYW
ncbi:unnamed protein product [Lactuca saligna]|uniref:Uncharacterized protein n=1 Tax=Lactuca saligna TaxID=75948 RepID=A0AA35ZIG5_LACSI|nr:unnamed protein product [Lactuca saligna]